MDWVGCFSLPVFKATFLPEPPSSTTRKVVRTRPLRARSTDALMQPPGPGVGATSAMMRLIPPRSAGSGGVLSACAIIQPDLLYVFDSHSKNIMLACILPIRCDVSLLGGLAAGAAGCSPSTSSAAFKNAIGIFDTKSGTRSHAASFGSSRKALKRVDRSALDRRLLYEFNCCIYL